MGVALPNCMASAGPLNSSNLRSLREICYGAPNLKPGQHWAALILLDNSPRPDGANFKSLIEFHRIHAIIAIDWVIQ